LYFFLHFLLLIFGSFYHPTGYLFVLAYSVVISDFEGEKKKILAIYAKCK
jgi:hypothetical protein